MGVLYASHYLWVIFAFQVIAGLLLLVNRYVPLAVAVLAPVIVNILSFHALMAPSGLPLALFVAVLWAVIFAFQVVAAVLLLANRYVPLAVAVLAPVIVNILSFHVLMAPSGLPLALFVAVLWAVIFVDVRPAFAGLFQARLQARA